VNIICPSHLYLTVLLRLMQIREFTETRRGSVRHEDFRFNPKWPSVDFDLLKLLTIPLPIFNSKIPSGYPSPYSIPPIFQPTFVILATPLFTFRGTWESKASSIFRGPFGRQLKSSKNKIRHRLIQKTTNSCSKVALSEHTCDDIWISEGLGAPFLKS